MRKSLLVLMVFCFMSAPVLAKDGKANKLERKIDKIEREFKEEIQKIEDKHKLSEEMKQLRIEQETAIKDLEIKQAKEMKAVPLPIVSILYKNAILTQRCSQKKSSLAIECFPSFLSSIQRI